MSFYKSRSDRGYRGGGGGFRGNRGGGDSWRGGGGRGSSFGSSRGGMSGSSRYFNSSPSTYESRPSRTYGGPSDRFASKPRDDYGSSTSFSRESDYGRVDDHRRPSPEPPRKRGRSDMSPTYPGARRSHERSYSSSDYTGRSGGYDDKGPGGGYLTEKGSYREVRESKPDYEFRKPMNKFSPRGGRSRGRSSLRSSYRGVSFRGSSRGRGFKGTTSLLARRRMESLGVRKRGGRYEYPRRPYYYRKRFAGSRMKKSDDEEDDDEMTEDDLDDEEVMDEEVDEEDETEETDEGNVDNADDEEDGPAEEDEGDGEETEVKEGEPVIKKEDDVIAEIKKEEDETSGENKKDVAVPVKKKSVVKKKAVVKKVVKKAAEDKSKTEEIGEEDKPDDGEEGEIVEEKDKEMVNARGQPFIRLTCPHCKVGCVTFREYSFHLSSRKHAISMKNLSVKLRSKLTAMRVSQRKKQRVLDSDAKSNNLRLKTFFCQVCKLNYRTLKSEHCASVEHKKMKEFLMPSCRICMLTFKSPWAYENHISDIAHFRRKARAVEKKNTTKETIDLDPSSFMVLDAVGSGDEDEESEKSEVEGETKEGEVAKEKENSAEKKKKKKDEIKLGADYCKLLEVYWCELCKIYLPRMEDREKSLTLHCRSRTHLQRFVRYRGDQTLRKRAVRLHKELEKEREKEKELLKKRAKKEGDTDDGEPRKEEEKVWNEMEQNISDILTDDPQEGGPEDEGNAEDEPEDDDSRQESERYDRFKQSEKEAKANGLSTDEIVKIDPVKDQK